MKLNEWIRCARLHAKMSQETLGEYLGKTKANISHWENGAHEPSYAQLLKIIEATGFKGSLPGLEEAHDKAAWPFEDISLDKIRMLSAREIIKLETLIQVSAQQIGLDVITSRNKE